MAEAEQAPIGGDEALDEQTRSRLSELAERHDLGDGQARALAALLVLFRDDPRAPTAIRSPREGVDRHVADALAALDLDVVQASRRTADIGSGAGVPGLPLAVALPKARLSLVDSAGRKVEFLRGAIAALGLANVEAVSARAESWDAGLGANDLVTARALAAAAVVVEYAAPLLRVGGALVDWRSELSADEQESASGAAHAVGMRVQEVRHVVPFPGADRRRLYVYVKVRDTPDRFPRRPGIARKRPLQASTDA